METFGDRLRRLRDGRGLKAGELAMQAGVTEGAIRQMESGQTKSASLQNGLKIARALGVSPEELAGLPDRPATPQTPGLRATLEDVVSDLQKELGETNLRLADLADAVLALKAERRLTGKRRQSS